MIKSEADFWRKLHKLVGGHQNLVYVDLRENKVTQVKTEDNSPKSFMFHDESSMLLLLINRMVEFGLLEYETHDLGGRYYSFTLKGIDYNEYVGKEAYEKKANDRKERIRHWVPIIISSALSLIAIAISIIALTQSAK